MKKKDPCYGPLWLKTVLLSLLLSAFAHRAPAQYYDSLVRKSLIARLRVETNDSARIGLCNDAASDYLRHNMLDSALYYSGQAMQLGQTLHWQRPLDQAIFFSCKAYAMAHRLPETRMLIGNATGRLKVRLLIEMGEQYAFRLGLLAENLDSAYPYIQRAFAYCDSIGDAASRRDVRCLAGKYSFERGDVQKGIDYFMQNIRECRDAKDTAGEAHWWSEFGLYSPGINPLVANAHRHAISLYESVGNREEAIYSLRDLALYHLNMGQLDSSEMEMNRVIQFLDSIHKAKMYPTLIVYGLLQMIKGNTDKALDAAIKAKKNLDSLQWDADMVYYWLIGNIYWILNKIEPSQEAYFKVLNAGVGIRGKYMFGPMARIAEGYCLLGNPGKAEKFLQEALKTDQLATARAKADIDMAWYVIHEQQHRAAEVEADYRRLQRDYEESQVQTQRDVFFIVDIYDGLPPVVLGRHLVEAGKFKEARPLLLQSLNGMLSTWLPIKYKRDVYKLLFMVDSATGDLGSAIRQRLMYETFSDSIASLEKTKQLNELLVKYETDQKDKDIALLNQQSKLQEASLLQSKTTKNLTIGGLAITLLIISLLYFQYRSKQRNLRTISEKNSLLQQTVEEKEWLVKEIHHRVKNNLQTVVALLGAQSSYLSNDALDAIKDSQNRVFSISLIHQKLYQQESMASIEMSKYLPELVGYLSDVFHLGSRIKFDLAIAPVVFDVSQAVPVALILNEAITNSIKYAFPGNRTDNRIRIVLDPAADGSIQLAVSDNGVGFPPGLDVFKTRSLGLKLIRGLSGDLGGTLDVHSEGGVTLCISFRSFKPFPKVFRTFPSPIPKTPA